MDAPLLLALARARLNAGQGSIQGAWASPRGAADKRVALTLVRVDPLVVPKQSLTGAGTERVDTRVLRVVYAFDPAAMPAYPGQQMDVFIALRR